MSLLQNELIKTLNNKLLTPHFQPIVSIYHKNIMGYEALIRGPSDSPLHSPFNLFDTAERFDLSAKLEYICREVTIKRYASLNIKEKLFINVSPSVLLQPDFKKGETLKLLEQFGVDPRSIVIELTEHQPTDDFPLMLEAVTHYRKMGFEIAIDDLGAGYSGLRLWSELQPEFVKIDMHFIQGIHNDPVKLNFVRSIQNIASSLNCSVIAEGIETEDEFKAVEQLGITHAQGYYFARPAAAPLGKVNKSLFITSNQPNQFNAIKAAHIAKFITPVSSETAISDVMGLFHSDSDLTILPLVDDDVASGIIFRDHFLFKLFSNRYGIELYGKKPIKSFIEYPPLSFDQNTAIELVSKQLTSTMRNDQAFIITNNGEYLGVGTILNLLEEITRQQIHNAKHANPLTLLPGSVPINDRINRLLAAKRPFSFGYFDLDHFKPFNDVYGYSAGDDFIKAVANTLTQYISSESGLVGHIGGDDFIAIFFGDDWLTCCENILNAFEKTVPHYYKDEDIKAGGIYAENRAGESCFFPMISLSVGLVDSDSTSQCQSHVGIADLASEAKKQAKKIEGNSFFIGQRKAVKTQENHQSFAHKSVLKLQAVN
ncbi:bifunctional diguanylate cyclase/phosphodiesterase [Methylobacter sp.]|uniref:GGDEF domain-containing protein n=1 Tax=Methylobacter sp. TaxID=2051955 RepID=UPI0011F5D27D|nr:bifunctional diguanylate cyclase/phosphodiesterase [Methylobacter sp.]TAK62899.1 MAG: GGDEF domain-containing protein [Methylobacter sp.]